MSTEIDTPEIDPIEDDVTPEEPIISRLEHLSQALDYHLTGNVEKRKESFGNYAIATVQKIVGANQEHAELDDQHSIPAPTDSIDIDIDDVVAASVAAEVDTSA